MDSCFDVRGVLWARLSRDLNTRLHFGVVVIFQCCQDYDKKDTRHENQFSCWRTNYQHSLESLIHWVLFIFDLQSAWKCGFVAERFRQPPFAVMPWVQILAGASCRYTQISKNSCPRVLGNFDQGDRAGGGGNRPICFHYWYFTHDRLIYPPRIKLSLQKLPSKTGVTFLWFLDSFLQRQPTKPHLNGYNVSSRLVGSIVYHAHCLCIYFTCSFAGQTHFHCSVCASSVETGIRVILRQTRNLSFFVTVDDILDTLPTLQQPEWQAASLACCGNLKWKEEALPNSRYDKYILNGFCKPSPIWK